MNSKLRDILNNLVDKTYGLHSVQIKEVPKAEKAIRQAVSEEILGLIGEDEPDQVIENLPEGVSVVHVNPKNQLKAELRQKIKEWQGGEDV